MEVILLERVHNLGQIGDVVKVKPGYARNFLLPLRPTRASSRLSGPRSRPRTWKSAAKPRRSGARSTV
jgi:hypothetical protein